MMWERQRTKSLDEEVLDFVEHVLMFKLARLYLVILRREWLDILRRNDDHPYQ